MAENSVEERMLELIEEICDDEIIREERDADLFEEGLLDSMAAIELLVAIETEFGVTIAPTAVEREEMNYLSGADSLRCPIAIMRGAPRSLRGHDANFGADASLRKS